MKMKVEKNYIWSYVLSTKPKEMDFTVKNDQWSINGFQIIVPPQIDHQMAEPSTRGIITSFTRDWKQLLGLKKEAGIDTLARRSSNLFYFSYVRFCIVLGFSDSVGGVFNACGYNYIPSNRLFRKRQTHQD